jgi:hypothetical protein
MAAMNSTNVSSRFLLLPETSEAPASAKQPVLRRYSLTRLAALRPVSAAGSDARD